MDCFASKFSLSDLPDLRRIRINCYGEFDVLRFTKSAKRGGDLVWILKDANKNDKVVGYIILYERGKVDAWVYQIGCVDEVPQEGTEILINKAEEILRNKGYKNIRVLVRDHDDEKIKNALIARSWKKIDSIWIMERKTTTILKKPQFSMTEDFEVIEADAEKHLEGVVHADRAAFIFGHRVPRESLSDHLRESGAFVAIEKHTNDVAGYNYNTIDNNETGHFIRLATLPDYRRKGIASQLIIQALKWFENHEVQKIYLRTIPESAGSQLYKKFGFIHTENESTYEIILSE
ncbi:MAG: GNAT family N-acetyltransferase [Candidatus Hodarchaeales archaeon]